MMRKRSNKWNKKIAIAVVLAMAAWLPISSANILVKAEEISPEGGNQEELNSEELNLGPLGLEELNPGESDQKETEEEIGLRNLLGMNPEEIGLEEEVVVTQPKAAPNVQATGTCGGNATWALADDGTLTISGTGEMAAIESAWVQPLPADHYLNYQDGIKNVVVEEGITSIGNRAFNWCSNLTEVTLPNSITNIGSSAFIGCSSLSELTIPDSVTSIEASAFSICDNLAKIELPNRITSIEDSVFSGCNNLSQIELPNSVTSIKAWAFSGCRNLAQIELPNSVVSIDRSAFSGCRNLAKIELPNSVTSIGNYTFGGCSSLSEVIIPDSVTSIGSEAFSGCSSLTKVGLPNGITSIEAKTFDDCTSLAEVVLPDHLANIGDNAFRGCSSLANISIPGSVTAIGAGAFHNCTSLSDINIPEGVQMINSMTFQSCSNLKSISLSGSVASIEYNAFLSCTSLPEVTIPASVNRIEGGAFADCSSLATVHFKGGAPKFSSKRADYGPYADPLEPFSNVTANVHYSNADSSWTSYNMLDYGGHLTWMATGTAAGTGSVTANLRIDPIVTDKVYVIGSGTGAVIKCTGELKDFVSIAIDGVVLDPSSYTAVSGSTVITISSSYLDKLSVGRHKVTLNYTYGSVDTTLLVLDRKTGGANTDNLNGTDQSNTGNQGTGNGAEDGTHKAPKTGDASSAYWPVVILMLCCGGLALAKRRTY